MRQLMRQTHPVFQELYRQMQAELAKETDAPRVNNAPDIGAYR